MNNNITIQRHGIKLLPDSRRVILRPFIPSDPHRIVSIIGRALAMNDLEIKQGLATVYAEFESRHLDIESVLEQQFAKVEPHVFTHRRLSSDLKLFIGSLFTGEYALESAALFNPSIVPHPDQSDVPEGGLRFIMSLRATGEGHISSIEFRVGLIESDHAIHLDPVSRYVSVPEVLPNPTYIKQNFILKLHEMGFDDECVAEVMDSLADRFTREDLARNVSRVNREWLPITNSKASTLECIQWLADSNYELCFSPGLALSERIIFPVSDNESNGIEDARFVRFVDDNGAVTYCATYTAYNGTAVLPQLIETEDFLHFRVLTLNGSAVQNKGMALFPRRVNGQYAMLSRQDDENLLIMFSDSRHFWSDPQLLLRPAETWESVKIGNCGSPIETEAGWLVLTHGVGPMRKYCIGAALLDLDDPTRVIGRLREPLLSAEGTERDGYVPNVVYSCGSLLHGKELILPYAISDKVTTIARVSLDHLIAAMQSEEAI